MQIKFNKRILNPRGCETKLNPIIHLYSNKNIQKYRKELEKIIQKNGTIPKGAAMNKTQLMF